MPFAPGQRPGEGGEGKAAGNGGELQSLRSQIAEMQKKLDKLG
jgi:hypothetical protein